MNESEDFPAGDMMNPQITQMSQMEKRDPQTYAIIGAAMEVHRELGCGFLESVYQEALAMELAAREIPHRREVELPLYFKGRPLATSFRCDFLCYEAIVVEIKARTRLIGSDQAQIINYLKAAHLDRGLLLNFGAPSLEYERFANMRNRSRTSRNRDSRSDE